MIDLSARVVCLPVRHHSPACARRVAAVIREVRPAAVLIEGPRDATPLLPFLLAKTTRMPVAIYTTYVRRSDRKDVRPRRHAAFYPFCDYSPELAAVRAGTEVGARVRLIDLTFPEMVTAGRPVRSERAESLLSERYLAHSRLLAALCQRAGARDPDDLWDHLFEAAGERRSHAEFFGDVLAYCEAARRDYTDEMLRAEGMPARESAMAAEIAEETREAKAQGGRIVVVSGGFHTPALLTAPPKRPKPMKVAAADAQVVLMRYGFPQLDRLNGYASGMPSPGFYQRQWQAEEPERLFVDLGRRLSAVSTADVIAAAAQARRLAELRRHDRPSREDVLDGVRSALVKGPLDAEGTSAMAAARALLAGDRVGRVPPEAGVPPIVEDFRTTCDLLGLEHDRLAPRQVTLDLYRRVAHRETSRFLFRLAFLEVPFGQRLAGPDFVAGEELDRVQEIWAFRWRPETDAALIEASLYGASIAEAAAARLQDSLAAAQAKGLGQRSDVAASLLVEACRMGLHAHARDVLSATAALVAEDASFSSVVATLEALLLLRVSQEVLEAHDLPSLPAVAREAYERACYLLPQLAGVVEAEEPASLDALLALQQAETTLAGERRSEGEDPTGQRELLLSRLEELAAVTSGNAALRGAAAGSLFAEGRLGADPLAARLAGELKGAGDGGAEGAAYLRGLLAASRSVLWQVPQVMDALHALLAGAEDAVFLRLLPRLRLAFARLSPRETERLAQMVAARAGGASSAELPTADAAEEDVLAALEVDARVRQALHRDGLLETDG